MPQAANQPTPRREFLGHLAVTAAALASAACAPTLAATATEPAPAPRPSTPPAPIHWDDSWVARLTAKHKAVFDSPAISDGLALGQAFLYMRGYQEMYQATDADVQAVIVMRHAGLPLALGDALWDKYEIGKMLKVTDPATDKPARRNPFYKVDPRDKNAFAGGTLDALHERGAILLGCNLAAMGFAERLAQKTNADVAAVREEVRSGLVPGARLMPSGIFAVIRAQEAGCCFMRST